MATHSTTADGAVVRKTFLRRESFFTEVNLYEMVSGWAAPRLMKVDEGEIVMERGIPITESRIPKTILGAKCFQLLTDLHEAGINHRDPAIINWVLIDGEPRLIDWEAAISVTGGVSHDLYGGILAGRGNPPSHEILGKNGSFWGDGRDISLGHFLGWKPVLGGSI